MRGESIARKSVLSIEIILSELIDMFRALAIFWTFGIVLFHTSIGVRAIWFKELMSDCRIAGVGFFFFVSGYFLMKRFEPDKLLIWWRDAVSRRLSSIIVPYFVWCVMGLLLFKGEVDLLKMLGITSVYPTLNSPLWYLKFLFVFVLLSPVVVIPIVHYPRVSMGALVLCLLVAPILSVPMKFSMFYSFSIFVSGLAFALYSKCFGETFVRKCTGIMCHGGG